MIYRCSLVAHGFLNDTYALSCHRHSSGEGVPQAMPDKVRYSRCGQSPHKPDLGGNLGKLFITYDRSRLQFDTARSGSLIAEFHPKQSDSASAKSTCGLN